LENKIKQIMADIFFIEISEIDENTSPQSIDAWDSLGHMNLVTALEEELEISFDNDEVIEMLNFKLIMLIVSEKIIK
jgi:acyl carrier protein